MSGWSLGHLRFWTLDAELLPLSTEHWIVKTIEACSLHDVMFRVVPN